MVCKQQQNPKTIIIGSKTNRTMERKIKGKIKIATNANGHFWPKHYDAHFEHHCQIISIPNFLIFLHGLQDHINVIILMLANHAETLSDDFNKKAKWEFINRNKITQFWVFHQTSLILQTNATEWCYIIWAPHP